MSWQGIEGHDSVVDRFRRALARGRLASSFLFVGPPGVGKFAFAIKLAQSLLCERNPEAALEPCGQCAGCVQVTARSHPDLIIVKKPPDKSEIPLALLIGSKEKRMREGLIYDISLRPARGRRKIAIIDDADDLNEEGANCLLKTLEEPPPGSVLILLGTNLQAQLPTIRSRCQMMRFDPLPAPIIERLVLEQGIAPDAASAQQIASFCEGSLQRARESSEPALWEFRRSLLARLATGDFDERELTDEVEAFVKEAVTEAPPRRLRLKQVVGFFEDFFFQTHRAAAGCVAEGDEALRQAVAQSQRAKGWPSLTAARGIERCEQALWQVDANANQGTLIAAFLDDLAQIIRQR